jgi:hypothetical protein
MDIRDRFSRGNAELRAVDANQIAQAHLAHITTLRAARVQHKAIARGLQLYFDSVAAEQIPGEFLEILHKADQEISER